MKSGQLFAVGLLAVLLPLTLASVASAEVRHRVSPGDTLSYLAQVYVVTVGEIVSLNGIPNPDFILPGQELRIPGGGSAPAPTGELNGSYTVESGDTLSKIAAYFNISIGELASANGIADVNYLYIGQSLVVPGLASAAPPDAPSVPELQFPSRPNDPLIEGIIEEMAAYYGVDPALVKALATVESGWRQGAVSSAGAVGVMQIMPGTAAWLETAVFGMELYEGDSAYDNIKMGVKYLSILLAETGGSEREAVASYYQGLSPTQAGVFYPDTQNYVATVMAVRLTYWP